MLRINALELESRLHRSRTKTLRARGRSMHSLQMRAEELVGYTDQDVTCLKERRMSGQQQATQHSLHLPHTLAWHAVHRLHDPNSLLLVPSKSTFCNFAGRLLLPAGT